MSLHYLGNIIHLTLHNLKSKWKCLKKITAFLQNTMDLLSKILAFLSEASVGNKINNQAGDELCQLARHTFFFLHLCQVVFLRDQLPVRCSSCDVYFMRGCLLVMLSFCEAVSLVDPVQILASSDIFGWVG